MIGTRGIPATHGGVERAVEGLSRQLVERGHDVVVYGRKPYVDGHVTDVHGIKQITLPAVDSKHLEAVSHTSLATLHALSRGHFDVVHYHATGPGLFSPIPRLAGVPTVVTVQGLDWKREKWGAVARSVLRLAARVSANGPTETIVVSRELRRILRDAYGAEPVFIPNGVDFSELDEPPTAVPGLESGRFVLFLGRIVPEKQVHILVDAFRRLDTDMRLAIAGPSLHAEDYFAQVKATAGGDPRVLFLGPQYGGEKNWLLHNARLFVQPSTIEGLPIALLEALACGREVVVSDIPENIEAATIRGEFYARSFVTGDPLSLVDAIRPFVESDSRLLPDPTNVTRQEFGWPRLAARTEEVYRQAMGAAR